MRESSTRCGRAAGIGKAAEEPLWRDGLVTTTPGFQQAFRQFEERPDVSLQHPGEFGG
jgi:hypothetical protein